MADVLVVPPFRTPLLTANGVPLSALQGANGDKSAGGPPGVRTTIETARDWWLYWRTLAEFANAGLNMLTYGNSQDRPDAGGMPDGAIFVESDRSGVIYQNQGGEWHYLAGTMYGTISPDQRPPDLGVNDAGFEFRSTDTNPLLGGHDWLWSGSAWVEITPIRYGGHGTRLSQPLADTWNGMLWVETDRSGVIYQNQSGVWHFLAGTMWGTLSPDQRPTDLGPNDAGFVFRATDQPRAFVWSGTAWVETTPVAGAANLTHPNVVTKVGAAGQIVEGGITDQSAANSDRLHITALGNVGVGTPSANAPFQVGAGTPLAAGVADLYGANRSVAAATALVNVLTTDPIGLDKGGNLGLGGVGGGNPYVFAIVAGRSENNAFAGYFQVCTTTNGGNVIERMRITSQGAVVFPNLPSVNPGAGSKQLWFDPADGNRVKFAP